MKLFVAAFLLIGVLLHHCRGAVYSEDDYRGFRQKCSKILQTSAEIMQQAEQKKLTTDNREMHCLVRCVGILSEFYDDETGTNWDMVARQVEGKEGFEQHRQATASCVEALPAEELQSDACRKSYLHFRCNMDSAKQHIKAKN